MHFQLEISALTWSLGRQVNPAKALRGALSKEPPQGARRVSTNDLRRSLEAWSICFQKPMK